MNNTQRNGSERKVEQVEVAPVHLVGLQMVDGPELAAVEGGSFSFGGVTFILSPEVSYLKLEGVTAAKL